MNYREWRKNQMTVRRLERIEAVPTVYTSAEKTRQRLQILKGMLYQEAAVGNRDLRCAARCLEKISMLCQHLREKGFRTLLIEDIGPQVRASEKEIRENHPNSALLDEEMAIFNEIIDGGSRT